MVLAGAYGAYWGYRFLLSRLGAVAPLAFAVAAFPLLLGIVAWLWHRYDADIARHANHIARWAWSQVEGTGRYRAARARFPALFRFANGRLDPHGAAGLGLSIILIAAAGALWAFVEVLIEVMSGTPLTTVDHRMINLFQMLRTPAADRIMLGLTYIGSGRGTAALAGAAILTAILLRRWRDALMIVASLLAGSAFFAIIKLIIQRPRPPLYDARIVQSGFSFPSGHATMAAVFYATVAAILVQSVRAIWLRVLVVLLTAGVAFAIGLSRVYLGVHYPSDVLAGWAGGALWALLVLAATHLWRAEHSGEPSAERSAEREAAHTNAVGSLRRAAAALVPVAALVYLGATRPAVPPPPTLRPPAPALIPDAQLLPTLRARLPRYTAGLFGHRQEPINLIFVGSASDLVHAFRAAGWVQADQLSWGSLRRALIATLTGTPDAVGPVTPSFLGELPESLAFSQPVGRTFARRHHIRIWLAPYELSAAEQLWLATASYDSGYAIAAGSLLPVHQIAPDIDDERDYVAASLARTNLVADTTRIQLVPPEMGTNAFGEPFFTYGEAILLQLRGLALPGKPRRASITDAEKAAKRGFAVECESTACRRRRYRQGPGAYTAPGVISQSDVASTE